METEPPVFAPTRTLQAEIPQSRALIPLSEPKRSATRHWRRRIAGVGLLTAGLAAVVFAALQVWFGPVVVTVIHPGRGTAIEAVYATGVVEAIDYAHVGTTVAGRIIELTVDEGASVHRGQVLAKLDERQARHRLEDAKARLALADEELKRDRALIERGFRSQQALQRTQEERDRAAANVDLAARQLEDYTIEAPLDGIIMKRSVKPGETVAANAVLFELSSTARLRVAADVDERDIAQVLLGAAVAVRADGFPGQAFPAAVTNIRRQGDTSLRTFRVEADLPADTRLMIGMTVDTDIVTAERHDALLVPVAAVGHGPPQGGRPGAAYVFRIEQGRAGRVSVQTGAVGPEKVELLTGVSDNDTLVGAAPERLKDGQAVRPRP